MPRPLPTVRPLRGRRRSLPALVAVSAVAASLAGPAVASTPDADSRVTHDESRYVSDYALVTGTAYSDPTLTECSRSRGRQNEPSVAIDPRDTRVVVGSSNDYCGVYNDGEDEFGAPIPSGPIWLGYYRSTNGGASFVSSLMPGYPGDASPYAARSGLRTASAGDPVLAWDDAGRLFLGTETSDDPAGTGKTFGDVGVATYANPQGPGGPTVQDGKEFTRSIVVDRGSASPTGLGQFNDKTAIEVDRTGAPAPATSTSATRASRAEAATASSSCGPPTTAGPSAGRGSCPRPCTTCSSLTSPSRRAGTSS